MPSTSFATLGETFSLNDSSMHSKVVLILVTVQCPRTPDDCAMLPLQQQQL